jgi:hypothetical protein
VRRSKAALCSTPARRKGGAESSGWGLGPPSQRSHNGKEVAVAGRTLRRNPDSTGNGWPLDFVLCAFLAGRMFKDDEPSRPMTLGSMRRHGVRGLQATCQHCGHERAVSMDDWPDEATVPSFGPRMRCSRCGKLGATAVPNWIERADRLPGSGRR